MSAVCTSLFRLSFPVLGAMLVASSGTVTPAHGQLISLRTVPLAAGNQFNVYPSARGGLGGLTIAIDDPLLDPFVNPALGRNLERSWIGGAPVFYGFDQGERGARTLPVTTLIDGDRWFGGGVLAFQQIRHEPRFPIFLPWGRPAFSGDLLSDRSSTNLYAHALVGKRFSGGSWAWGASVSAAGLAAVDGVELLYAGSERIVQNGSALTVRAGLAGTLTGTDELELTAVASRLRMQHDVTWVNAFWRDEPTRPVPTFEPRVERNLDRTDTWGLDGRYRRPLEGTNWTVGGLVTMNYKDHPKIPNYEIMNIPRDPGTSWAYNIGIGLAHETATTTFGIDMIAEPAWSNTWADAVEPIRRPDGSLITPGEKTIENDFTFLNSTLRVGIEQRHRAFALQLGLGMHAFDYDLTQLDRVEIRIRDQSESWIEWTPSWGLKIQLDDASIYYAGWALLGAGAPGVGANLRFAAEDASASSTDFLVAPSGPLTLQDIRLTTHQVTVTVPLR